MTLPVSALRFVGGVKVTTNGAGAPTVISRSNVTVPANGTGTGDLSITLGQGGVDRTQCVVFRAVEGAAFRVCSLVHTSDTAKQLLVFDDTGAAADGTVQFWFFQNDGTPLDPGSPDQDVRMVAGVLLTTNGAGAPVVIENFGCTVPAAGTGTGDITVTTPPIAANQCLEAQWDEGPTAQSTAIIHTSDTQKQILITDLAGVAADGTVGIFWFRPSAYAYT